MIRWLALMYFLAVACDVGVQGFGHTNAIAQQAAQRVKKAENDQKRIDREFTRLLAKRERKNELDKLIAENYRQPGSSPARTDQTDREQLALQRAALQQLAIEREFGKQKALQRAAVQKESTQKESPPKKNERSSCC